MNKPLKVLVAGHEPGGLNLLAPLLRSWADGLSIDARLVARPAVRRDLASRVPNLRLAQGQTDLGEWIANQTDRLRVVLGRVLDLDDYDVVLCGTSGQAALERMLLVEARRRGVPTISFCDMWCEYQLRFVEGAEWCLPDYLWVIDRRMAEEAAAVPWPYMPKIEIIGSPLFDELIALRGKKNVASQSVRFLSEPVWAYYPDGGLDEFDVAEAVLSVVEERGNGGHLIVRTHPSDDVEAWRQWLWARRDRPVRFDTMPLAECIADTKIAIGVATMLLAEMRLSGARTASFRPSQIGADYIGLPFERLGIPELVGKDALRLWLNSPFSESEAALRDIPPNAVVTATSRLLDIALHRV